jgi:origin recognition complex subunit 1
MALPPFTPRRSGRGAIFTPTPQPTPSKSIHPNTTFHWTSQRLAPPSYLPDTERCNKTYYNSFTRITSHPGLTPGKGKGKSRAREDERRFTVGDGVIVDVEGGNEGVGVLVRLWEEEQADNEEDLEQDEDDGEVMRMMGEVHWCFRRQDLPGVMKNLSVQDVRPQSYLFFATVLIHSRMKCC